MNVFLKHKTGLEFEHGQSLCVSVGTTHQRDARTRFENPMELLKGIKQHALRHQEHQYEMSIIIDMIKSHINLRQKENGNLQDYTRCFKTANDVFVSYIGGPVE